jgi:hypothetical protein
MASVGSKHTAEQVREAMSMARTVDALVGRLSYDQQFAAALANNPREALEEAGLSLDKEGIELLMTVDPGRFDRACEAMFGFVDSDFLHKLVMPSCDSPNWPQKPPSAAAEKDLARA